MKLPRLFRLCVVTGLIMAPLTLHAQPAGRITGVGGLFVKSKDPRPSQPGIATFWAFPSNRGAAPRCVPMRPDIPPP